MGYTVEQNGRSYDQGKAAGEIAQQLKGFAEHFARNDATLDKVAAELRELNLQMQRYGDARNADKATVLTTADAVEKERVSTAQAVEKQRKTAADASLRRWSPLTRLGIAVGILVPAAGGLAWLISSLIH